MVADPPVTIVLPAYVPTESLLSITKDCLLSLSATTPRDAYQLVVVDNGSTPEASDFLHRAADLYLYYDAPIGYGRAANIGLTAGKHDWLVVLNTDIEFCEAGWLSRMLSDYQETPGGILSAMDDGRKGLIYDESWFSCWITHREVVQKVGYFDESMSYRFHDQDYAIRVHRAGYRVMRTGNVPVSHINMATYSVMGRGMGAMEDPLEQEIMRKRWGQTTFSAWLAAGQPVPV